MKVSDLEKLTGPRKRGKSISPSIFVREHLREIGPDYISSMWREWKELNRALEWKPSSYNSFRSMFRWLRRLGLVIPTGLRQPSSNPWLAERVYFALVPEKVKSDAWRTPRKEYDKLPVGIRHIHRPKR